MRTISRVIACSGLLYFTALMMCGCEDDGNEAQLPDTPLLNPQASSIPQGNAIRIEWEVSGEDDLAGCKIYRGTSSEEEDFVIIATVSEKDGFYEDADVSTGVAYYYKISVFDDSGNESGKSDVVNYTLLEKPIPVEPSDQAVVETLTPTFTWLGVSGASAYNIHLQSRSADSKTWDEIWQSEKIYPYQELRKIYNDDNLALKPLEIGMTYRWRVDSSGGRHSGSQSRWRYFSVPGSN